MTTVWTVWTVYYDCYYYYPDSFYDKPGSPYGIGTLTVSIETLQSLWDPDRPAQTGVAWNDTLLGLGWRDG
jgi:hypothetical protein